MNIDVPIREFGDAVDTSALREAVLAMDDDAWRLNDYRQQTYEVHRQTESVVMIFTDGSGWPEIEITKEPGWDLLAETAMPVMHEIIEKFYQPGGTIVRAMAAKLLPGGIIRPHKDSHPSFHAGHRIHIPVVTNSRVRFMLDGRPHAFEVGKAYEINNQLTHSVMNKGKEARIHFIFDYIPPEQQPNRGRASQGGNA